MTAPPSDKPDQLHLRMDESNASFPSPSFRVHQRCDQARLDPIAGLENVAPDIAFRNAHSERFQLIKAMPLDPKQQARLAELDAFIEAERERRALRRSLMASDRQGGPAGIREETIKQLARRYGIGRRIGRNIVFSADDCKRLYEATECPSKARRIVFSIVLSRQPSPAFFVFQID